MRKLLYTSLAGNVVLLVGLVAVLVMSNSDDQATETAGSRAAATEGVVATEPAAATEPTVATQPPVVTEPAAPTAVAEAAQTEPASGSTPQGALGLTAPTCFDHFFETHPSVRSGTWVYMTSGEEQFLHSPSASVVVIVDDYEIVGAVRFQYQTIGGLLNLYDGLDSDCEPIEITEQQPDDGDRYIAAEIDDTEYRLHVYTHVNVRLGTVWLEKP